MKVETHNHPTAIAPYAGAATGAGGEVDEVQLGGKPKQVSQAPRVALAYSRACRKWNESGQVSTQTMGRAHGSEP